MGCEVCMGINSAACPKCGKEAWKACPECEGDGHRYIALHVNDEDEEVVTFSAWLCLPLGHDEALARRQKWHRGERELCPRCDGLGIVRNEHKPIF